MSLKNTMTHYWSTKNHYRGWIAIAAIIIIRFELYGDVFDALLLYQSYDYPHNQPPKIDVSQQYKHLHLVDDPTWCLDDNLHQISPTFQLPESVIPARL